MEGAASFEEAKRVAAAAVEALRQTDIAAAEELIAEDVEYVTREGTKHGRKHVVDVWRPQLERFKIDFELERVVDAGNGKVIMLQTVTRRNPDTDEVEVRAWPATVLRVRDGQIVFVEGYQDRRKAFTDLGLEPE
jgi:ketosteroid isomerase-like protein